MPATIPLLQEGRYSIEQEFPHVENCSLFQAYDTKTEMPVTIVEVPLQLPKVATAAQREAASASFVEQAKKLTAFKHKSVVAVRSFFTEGGRNYLVTDPVDGIDLASVLADQKQPFTIAQITGWADTVLDALNVMHNSRPALVYRNLRPENVVLRADGTVQLVVSGMMCSSDQGPIAYSPLEQIWSGLDAASQKVIISKYDEASERVLKQDLDARSDLYSLGATLYNLVTGHTPVDALERSIEMIEGNPDPLNSPNKLDSSIPVEVSDVIMKAMEIKREYRFDSAAIMRQVLKTALVRVKEREAEESLGQKVAEQDLRPAVQNAPPTPAKNSRNEAVLRELRKAEEERVEAERRTAETEKKLHETEAATAGRVTETFNLTELEDDVLGLLSPSAHTSEPPQVKVTPTVNTPVVEQKPEKAPAASVEVPKAEQPVEQVLVQEPVEQEPAISAEQQDSEEVSPQEDRLEAVGSGTLESEPEVDSEEPAKPEEPVKVAAETAAPAKAAAAAASFSTGDSDLFAERKSGGFGLPAIAAAAVVLCIAAVGGWFYFGSSSAPAATAETPAATRPAQPEQPATTALQPTDPSSTETTAVPAADQPAANQQIDGQPDQQPEKVASTGPARSKKPAQAPSKSPAQKKVVTVDDLINDN